MSRKIILTIIWMVIFTAVMVLINGSTLFALDHLPSWSAWYFVWMMRLLFYSSPLIALLLGMRGFLPGTKPSAVTARNVIPLIVGLLVVVTVTWVTWIVFHPAHRPKVSIAFLGYTNDAGGTRLAGIAVTNLGTSSIFVYLPTIEIQSPAQPRGFTNFFQGNTNQWRRFQSTLGIGSSGSFVIPVPTNESPWRMSFFVYPDVGASRFIKNIGVYSYIFLGFRPRYQTMPFDVRGDWIENRNGTDR